MRLIWWNNLGNVFSNTSPNPYEPPGFATPRLLDFIVYIGLFINWKVVRYYYLLSFLDKLFTDYIAENDILILDKIIEKNISNDKKN